MRFAIEKKNARAYRSGSDWFLARLARIPMEEAARAARESGIDPFQALDMTEKQKTEINRRLNLWDKELEAELTRMNGMVFVEGEFSLAEKPETKLTIIREFIGDSGQVGDASKRFRAVRFRVETEATAAMKKLISKGKANLHVFGYVLGPLRNDGFIEVQAIAIY